MVSVTDTSLSIQLTSLITHRFRFPPDSVSLYAAKVQSRGLSAVAQCESLRYKLLNGLAVRRACYGVLRFVQYPFYFYIPVSLPRAR